MQYQTLDNIRYGRQSKRPRVDNEISKAKRMYDISYILLKRNIRFPNGN